jgi:hypothetical protein
MAKIWIEEVGGQAAREFVLKEAKFDFPLINKNDLSGVLLWPLEYKRFTLDANNVVQMYEKESGIKSPTSIHGYQNHPSTIQTMKSLLALLHRVSKVDCPNGMAEWDGVPSPPLCPNIFQKQPLPEISRTSWPCDKCNFTLMDSHNFKYGIKPQAYQHTFGVRQHKIMLFGNI